MSAEILYRLKTFHGTRLFSDKKYGLIHAATSEAPEVLAQVEDKKLFLFIEVDGRRNYFYLNDVLKLSFTSLPTPIDFVRNANGSISLMSGKYFWSARINTNLFRLMPHNKEWEHFTLEPVKSIEIAPIVGRNIPPVSRELCAGCTACAMICPKGAITMVEDDEGFLSPKFNPELCIDCGRCETVCPIKNPNKNPAPEISYAVWIADEERRLKSSSGGAAYALSKAIIERGGVVCGAALEGFTVKHILVDNVDELSRLQGTKYVQSDLGNNFVEIKRLLKDGRTILFTGTPCQVSGLKNFVRGLDKNLFTVDLICHGVPSPGVLRQYIDELRLRYPDAASVSFRDDVNGWGFEYAFSLFDGSNKNIFKESNAINAYLKGFLQNVIDRQSCNQCSFSTKERAGDVTVGDYWGIQKIAPELNDKRGTSMIVCNTDKGAALFDLIKDKLAVTGEIPYSFAVANQAQLKAPSKSSPLRAEFFRHFKDGGKVENYLSDRLTKIGILNLCNSSNIGAVLVAYSVSKAVEQLGYPTEIINFYPRRQPKNLRDFLHYYLQVSAPYVDAEHIKALNPAYKKIIVGSDQVWKFGDTGVNMLNWASGYKSFITYAASFGDNEYSGGIPVEQAAKLLKRFDFISVREASGVDICKNTFGIEAVHVVDPTMLLTREHYEGMINPKLVEKPDKPYVAYMLFDEADKFIRAGKGLGDFRNRYVLWNVLKYDNGVFRNISSWLAGIRDAECVITNSFHGTVFSILFNKQFVVVNAPGRGSDRIPSLFKLLNIPLNRFYNQIGDVTLKSFDEKIDYTMVNRLVEKEREKGFMFLKLALSAPPNYKKPID